MGCWLGLGGLVLFVMLKYSIKIVHTEYRFIGANRDRGLSHVFAQNFDNYD